MPWEETCAMDERMRFVIAASEEGAVMAQLCAEFGISRTAGEWFADCDQGRTEVLERLGVRLIRLANAEVHDDLDAVLARIRAELLLPFD